MSGFWSDQFAENGAVSASSSDPLQFTTTFRSFDQNTRYLVLVDGLARCPSVSGELQFDILFNGERMINTRTIQTASSVGTTPLGVNWPVQCVNCEQIQNDDETITYKNTLTLQFTWVPPSGTDATTLTAPTAESLSVSVLAVA